MKTPIYDDPDVGAIDLSKLVFVSVPRDGKFFIEIEGKDYKIPIDTRMRTMIYDTKVEIESPVFLQFDHCPVNMALYKDEILKNGYTHVRMNILLKGASQKSTSHTITYPIYGSDIGIKGNKPLIDIEAEKKRRSIIDKWKLAKSVQKNLD
jgi:hypothetical protein